MIDPREATDAGALVSYGLTGRVPTEGSEYGRLYDRYRTDPTFRTLVDGVASGLGLTVIGTPITGIVLTARAGSPFDLRLSDLPGGDRDDRLTLGLVLLGIAAYAYPRPEDLDVAEPVIVTIAVVERLMRGAIAPLAKLEAIDGSIESFAASAAAAYDRMPPLLVSEVRGSRRKGCTERVIEDAFRLLIEQKMAREGPRHGVDAYVLTDRFRVSVAEIAGSDALEVLRDLSATQRSTDEGTR
jgi:hypothetical protein